MLLKKNYPLGINFLNWLICLIPLSIIVGNLAINLNTIAICLLGLIIFKYKIFSSDLNFSKYLLYSFFICLVLITFVNNILNLDDNVLYKSHLIKSLFFLRFLILFLVLDKLIKEKYFNTKLFFVSCAFLASLVAIDTLVQLIFKQNLIGMQIPAGAYRPTSFFGTEEVVGGYLQKFSLFAIFWIAFLNKSENTKKIFIFSTFVLFFVMIFLAGNRMSALIFVSSFVFFFLIGKKTKFIGLISLFSICIIFFATYKLIKPVNVQFNSFFLHAEYILKTAPRIFNENQKDDFVPLFSVENQRGSSSHIMIFNTGVQLWKKSKIFGNGLKSIRIGCEHGNPKNGKIYSQLCSSHPHNYTIEILADTGLIGFSLISLIVIVSILNFLKFYFANPNFNSRLISMPFFLITIFEFFPIRSTGSFFTTGNAVVIFLMLSILINISKLDFFDKETNTKGH